MSGSVAGVFLDRDGTLNRAYVREGVSHPPMTEAQLGVLPGVPEALAVLSAAGFKLIVVTNQPDVARGTLTLGAAERIHLALRERLPLIDDLTCCYDDDADGCLCRKPLPGMLLRGASRFGLDVTRSFMVGDSWRDWEAGRRAGCRTIHLGAPPPSATSAPDYLAEDLSNAAAIVLRVARAEEGAVVENICR